MNTSMIQANGENEIWGYMTSPIGILKITASDRAVTAVERIISEEEKPAGMEDKMIEHPVIRQCCEELQEYFAGCRQSFDVPLAPSGTPFQQRVWNALCQIPYGKTRTYGDVAKMAGNPKASRAVGMANHRNPILILIPCHRVIGSDGSLTGYAAGLETKKYLLQLEKENGHG